MEKNNFAEKLVLSVERQAEIGALMDEDFKKWKESCGDMWKIGDGKAAERINPKTPSWETFATGNPVVVDGKRKGLGIRGCIAFHKVHCEFKRLTKGIGCSHCALSMGDKDLEQVEPGDQILAVERAITGITATLGYTPSIIEILPDGNFLHEKEVSPETQEGVFRLLSANTSIFQIAIESRPEYISAEKIRALLKFIRDDQVLEIYIGLESVDPFVLNKIIKKGFTLQQFENKIQEVSGALSVEEKRRLRLSVYHFFKPPYLTEKESIEAAISVAGKAKEWGNSTGIEFAVKYEPAVISDGTFQKYLFDNAKFMPPNYFSIAEIIACLYREKSLEHIKFGQRDDIDDFQTVAAISDMQNPKMFSPFDFMVYNAVQRFNADQDIWGFCADMSMAISNAPEFEKWERDVYGKAYGSALSRLFAEFKKSDFGDKYKNRMEFQKELWKLLDKIEYNEELSKGISWLGKEGESSIKAKLISLFLQANIKVLQIKSMKFLDIGAPAGVPELQNIHSDFAGATQDAVYQVEVIVENEAGLPQNVWVKVPLRPVEIDLSQFGFIYDLV